MYFSIVIPTYNRLPILQKCLLALENQDFDSNIIQDYEIIVVDDGSTDNSVEIAKKYPVEVIALPTNTKSWCADPLNIAVSQAKGKYIGHVASDDILYPNYLSSTIPLFEADDNIGFVRIGMQEIGENCIPAFKYPVAVDPQILKRAILIRNFVYGSSPHTKAAWAAIGGYRPFYLQDWDFWIRLILHDIKMATCNKILYKYRIHDQALSNTARHGTLSQEKENSLYAMALQYKGCLQELNIMTGELYAILAARNAIK